MTLCWIKNVHIVYFYYIIINVVVVSALHGMPARTSDEKGVLPSVCLCVHLSNTCIVAKRKKDLFRFLYRTKDHLA